jgi:hypothetical protein
VHFRNWILGTRRLGRVKLIPLIIGKNSHLNPPPAGHTWLMLQESDMAVSVSLESGMEVDEPAAALKLASMPAETSEGPATIGE